MQIKIKNFGPISEFNFDLAKDLNIIFGKNNIGKSYAITVVYLIIKNLTQEDFLKYTYFTFGRDLYFRTEHRNFSEHKGSYTVKIESSEKNIITKLKEKDVDEIIITEDVAIILSDFIENTFLKNLEKSFQSSFPAFESLSNKFSREKFTIQLVFKELEFTITTNGESLKIETLKIYAPIFAKKAKTNRIPRITSTKTTLYHKAKEKELDGFSSGFIFYYLNNSFIQEISTVVNKIYFLPASRSGLYQALSTFSAVIAELSQSRTFLKSSIELPNISEPVSDYFLYLSNIKSKSKNDDYAEIVKTIEQDVLNGEVLFNEESKKIVFSPFHTNVELDLSFASSMISEIAPIVAFFKYIISDNKQRRIPKFQKQSNLIFIEEPEAHLHPEIQVKLMAFFAELTKLNIKVVMTTHSNYMFNKLSNLILDKKIDYNQVDSYLMRMEKDKGSVVDKISMQATDEGMLDNNFLDVAEQLYEERINIYKKLNENAD